MTLDNHYINRFLHISALPNPFSFLFREFYQLFIGFNTLNAPTIKLLLKYLIFSKWSFFRKLNVFRNVLKKYSLHYIASKNITTNFIIDEGVSHIPFIFSTAFINYTPELIINPYKNNILVIIINTNPLILYKRIVKRGHKHIIGFNNHQIIKFLFQNQYSLVLLLHIMSEFSAKLQLLNNYNDD